MEETISKIHGKYDKKISLLIAILLILSAGVIFLKNVFTNVINLVLIFLFLFFCISKIRYNDGLFNFSRNGGKKIFVITVFIIIHFCFLFLLRGDNDKPTFTIFWYIAFIFCLFLSKPILDLAVKYFATIVLWIVIFALLNYIVSLLGISLPYITFMASTRDTTYYIYPGTVRLHGQNYDVFGREAFRLSGIFPEPSMFGLVCTFVIYSKAFINNKFKNAIIVIGVILSMSMGAIITLCGYVFFELKSTRQKIFVFLSISIILLLAFVSLPQEIVARFVLDKFSGDALEARTTLDFSGFYNNYLDHISISQLLIGEGVSVLDNYDFIVSDYRGLFIKFGSLGIGLYFLWLWSNIKKSSWNNTFLVAFIFLIIFLHRSWFLLSFIFMFFIYYISFAQNKIKSNKIYL
ncbi:hypothetical protein [Flavobacterium aquicola]|uniref:O-antigen ligase-like membrane protein n=1 Tax=Flavobacterium aquicola TaxID=1682742 RepID=A0A3E0EJ10_9FLAO|nr:hypothetical protein [Flavobacterium aquicola]REG98244.1 hypothetical protein C8P67_107171 [Flavobacterium aquicola]